MTTLVSRLFAAAEPVFCKANARDAAAIARVHAACFSRGWGEDEICRLLLDSAVVGHCVKVRRGLAGFVLSRMAAGEAEILSLAIAPAHQGRGLSRPLIEFHLRSLAGLGAHTVFLEVDEHNAPARRLYRGASFREVGRRSGYYESGAPALTLRRDLG